MRFTAASSFCERASEALRRNSAYSRLLVVFAVSGGGGLVVYADAGSNHAIASKPPHAPPTKKKIVVLGTGWAGTSFLKNLDSSLYDVQIISRRNYFAFTPLLPSVTCGGVDARSVVEPIRKIMNKRMTTPWMLKEKEVTHSTGGFAVDQDDQYHCRLLYL